MTRPDSNGKHTRDFLAFHSTGVAVSRPEYSRIGFVTLLGAAATAVGAAFPPLHASAQALVLLIKFENEADLSVWTVSREPVR